MGIHSLEKPFTPTTVAIIGRCPGCRRFGFRVADCEEDTPRIKLDLPLPPDSRPPDRPDCLA